MYGKIVSIFILILGTGVSIPEFNYKGNSHYDFGFQMGSRFAAKIRHRFSKDKIFQDLISAYRSDLPIQNVYNKFVKTHQSRFPEYMEELRGIAKGSNLTFEAVFIMNIQAEFELAIKQSYNGPMQCSDLVIYKQSLCIVGHNEDNAKSDLNHTALIQAKINDQPEFIAYTYLGDLPTGAFGYNENRIAFSLNCT